MRCTLAALALIVTLAGCRDAPAQDDAAQDSAAAASAAPLPVTPGLTRIAATVKALPPDSPARPAYTGDTARTKANTVYLASEQLTALAAGRTPAPWSLSSQHRWPATTPTADAFDAARFVIVLRGGVNRTIVAATDTAEGFAGDLFKGDAQVFSWPDGVHLGGFPVMAMNRKATTTRLVGDDPQKALDSDLRAATGTAVRVGVAEYVRPGVAPAPGDAVDVVLTAIGDKPIQVIKEVRRLTRLGFAETRDLMAALPATLKTGVSTAQAKVIAARLSDAGATVELK